MIIFVNPMWSVQTINSDSNYVFLSEVIKKFHVKYPDYYFVMPFPTTTGFKYYNDDFFQLSNVKRIPFKYPVAKKHNNMHFDTHFIKNVLQEHASFLIWNQIPEVAPQIKFLLGGFQLNPCVINQHHYIIHKSLPYPIEPDLHFVYMQLIGDHLTDLNLFNSEHCFNMTIDNVREYLPNLENSIKNKSRILKFGFFDEKAEIKQKKYEKFTFLYNHRFQHYKNWHQTFELFDELYKEKYDFQVIITKAGGDRINAINEKPYVLIKDLPTREQYFQEIQKCHCNTFNSQHETFCISILDSMHFGLSIIVPNSTTMPELVGKDDWQIFNNKQEQKEKLIELINNKNYNHEIGQKNIEKSEKLNISLYVDQ